MKLLQEHIDQTPFLIGFNLKFDLHWLRRYGIKFPKDLRVFDVQLAYYILTNQRNKFPSLEEVCSYYGVEGKSDNLAEKYWDKGIDTPDIPWDELVSYGKGDVVSTQKCYEFMKNSLGDKKKLIEISNMDLLVLEEMEWNGIKYDMDRSREQGDLDAKEIQALEYQLVELASSNIIDFNSSDHISVLLYGGKITVDTPELYEWTYKSGAKKGLTEIRKKHNLTEYEFPRLIEPLKGSQLKKEGYFGTNEATLLNLKATGKAKKIIECILKRSKLEKRRGTYYHGLPALYQEMNWKDNILHGQLNQTMAITGRLSSNKPNLQNISGDILECIISRYGD